MSDPLTIARFRELADAYGGVIARWPERYRNDAYLLAASPAAAAILARAAALDNAMNAWQMASASRDLGERVFAAAPRPPRAAARRLRLWWSGIGIATALTGAAAGTAALIIAAPIEAADGGTSFGDVMTQER